jgi:hypothetical protein
VRGVGSPGFLGYVAAYGVSAVVVPMPMSLAVFADGTTGGLVERVFGAMCIGLVGAIFAVVYGAPAAVIGSLAGHVLLLGTRAQWVHVALFAGLGAVAGVVYDRMLFDGHFGWLPWSLGLATALGRASVIPLARGRAS